MTLCLFYVRAFLAVLFMGMVFVTPQNFMASGWRFALAIVGGFLASKTLKEWRKYLKG